MFESDLPGIYLSRIPERASSVGDEIQEAEGTRKTGQKGHHEY